MPMATGIIAESSQELVATTDATDISNGGTSSSSSDEPNDSICEKQKVEVSSESSSLYQDKNIFEHVNKTSLGHTNIIMDTDPHQQLAQHEVVSIDESALLDLTSSDQVHVITADTNVTSVTGNNGAIYLLVSNDPSGTVLQTVDTQHEQVSIISAEALKNVDSVSSSSTVQIMNSEGVPVNINVNELLSTITGSKTPTNTTRIDPSSQSILSLSSSIISTTENNSNNLAMPSHNRVSSQSRQYVIGESSSLTQVPSVPNWALHLRDCTLYGDTYTGYVTNEADMDAVLNLYKKETQSLFAIRQTPSPAKDESTDTVRLMWKSQYVPYDGIPFVNVGRRATVMECEHGPRKRSNALKRMIQAHGHKSTMKKIPNLTCPARLFVKKVRKFPQFRVPVDADAKVLRQLQEQSLKLVRQAGFHAGEIRLYMQLPLPTAHRYHNVGSSIEAYQKELEDSDNIQVEQLAVDGRVLEKIQELVRQGFINPFIVRATVKDFVENKMELGIQEHRPFKHNKAFYPPLIEIQNMIQQTEAALNSGLVTPLPAPAVPPITPRQKRKRTASVDISHSPMIIKRVKVDAMKDDPTIVPSQNKLELKDDRNATSSPVPDNSETISLTLTDSQLEHFSVTNFTYDQLAQLAKIGLLALNNAAKDTNSTEGTEEESENTVTSENTESSSKVVTASDGTSILLVTPSNMEEEKAKIQVLTGPLSDSVSNTQVES